MGSDNRSVLYIKQATLNIFNEAIARHPIYGPTVKAYHKYSVKEKPQAGIELVSVSVDRNKLSPDDYMNAMYSFVALGRVASAPGNSIEWAWEDTSRITPHFNMSDVTEYLDPNFRSTITLPHKISAGSGIIIPAQSMDDVEVFVNKIRVLPAVVDGETGRVVLSSRVPDGATVHLSYHAIGIDKPGAYFIEMETASRFFVTPMYYERDIVIIEKATGLESIVNLPHQKVLQSPFVLYSKMKVASYKNFYVEGVDYVLTPSTGKITFLNPLPVGTKLYATYRRQGEDRGPFDIDGDYRVNYTAISGVVLAFGDKRHAGDKMVVVLEDKRVVTSLVFGNTNTSNIELKIFTRDPESSAEIADFLLDEIYGRQRSSLSDEGYIIHQMNHGGDGDESYQDNIQEVSFTNNLNLEVITEYKRYDPVLSDVSGFNVQTLVNPQEVITLYDRNGNTQNYEIRNGPSFFNGPKVSGPRIG